METANSVENNLTEDNSQPHGVKRLILFVIIAVAAIIASFFTPIGDYLSKDKISHIASSLGYWGPVLILCAGIVSPVLFLPRWPIAFAAGLLYGIFMGTVLANVAATLGAWLNFALAKTLLSPMADRLKHKYSLLRLQVPEDKAFTAILLLRIFPLSNFVATNLFAGILKLRSATFLVSTFFGMIPSTIMYASCGKLMKKPGPVFYIVSVLILCIFIISTYFAQKHLFRWLRKISKNKKNQAHQSELPQK